MTSSTTESTPQNSAGKNRRDGGQEGAERHNGSRPAGSPSQLDDLARAQEDLTQEVRQVAARELVEHRTDGDDGERAGRMLVSARSELLERLLAEQQEQARRRLAEAASSSEDAVAGVARSVTAIVRSVVPAALVRPEDLIEATYSLADVGLRVGRRLALTVSASARERSSLR